MIEIANIIAGDCRKERVVVRIRRYDNRAITVGFLQCLVLGLIKGEIGDPVVNEIDRLSVDAELTIVVAKVTGVGDDRVYPSCRQNLPREHEFGIKILFRRIVVDDGDAFWRARSTLPNPFVLEHAERRVLKG